MVTISTSAGTVHESLLHVSVIFCIQHFVIILPDPCLKSKNFFFLLFLPPDSDINKIRSGTGDKLALSIQSLSTAIAGLTIGFIKNWRLSLVIMAVSFVMIVPLFTASAVVSI